MRHKENRGVCPARNTGIRVASGNWIVPLDSDDELAPSAFVSLNEIIKSVPADVHQIRGMVAWDDGSLTPEPPMDEEVWDYDRYLSAINVRDGAGVESANVYTKHSLNLVPYPDDRSHEALFHLDWYRKYKARTTARVLRHYHTDALNSTRDRRSVSLILRDAPDHARQADEILRDHGAILRKCAPLAYRRVLYGGIKNHLLTGNRKRGLALAAGAYRFPTPRVLSYLLLGLVHRHCLAAVAARPPRWTNSATR